MKAILIDDERKVLDQLQEKISQLSNIEVLGAFTDPHQGLIEVSKQEPDVLFLAISIPEVNWIKVAHQLKNAIPEMKIVFLSTVDTYALEAFDIQVDDYLLKPVEDVRLEQAIFKVSEQQKSQESVLQPMICCFHKLHFCYYERIEDRLNIYWRTSKARDVFSYLVHHREKLVRKDVLVDLFWPDAPLRDAFLQLYSTIYQIRKSLTMINFDVQIVNSGNGYRLELNNVWIDVDVWEAGIKSRPFIKSENVDAHKELLYLYKGDYFEEGNHMWSMNERNRLQVKSINHMNRVINYYLSVDAYEEAMLLYLHYQEIAPFMSESYFGLMKLYALFNDRYAVETQYRLLKDVMEEEFGSQPDENIVAWYESWK